MGKSLIIVESPAKARTIKKYVGKDFDVIASMGHIMDLPKSRLGVDVEQGFEPKYTVIKEKKRFIDEIKKKAKAAEGIYLASDPDREGEAIAWHIKLILDEQNDRVKRVLFNEITKKGIESGMKNPRSLERHLYEAQIARRVLDRLVGYKLSPLLWSKVQKRLSAGRVQSVALKLICEREKEVVAFVPEEYWSISGFFEGKKPPEFEAKLVQKDRKKIHIRTKEEAEELLVELSAGEFLVKKLTRKTRKKHPQPPFNTSKMQQDAWRKLGFSADRTMRVAQSLYEGVELGDGEVSGLITYMRTDSVRVSADALDGVRKLIKSDYGDEFLPEKPNRFKNRKGVQDAHEAIRPADSEKRPKELQRYLTRDQHRLYKLIWERFVASQMSPARFEQVVLDISSGRYLLRATGQTPIFSGFLEVYAESVDNSKDGEAQAKIPELEEGEDVKLVKLEPKQHFTQPPPRFTESSLIKVLEERGIGRPSTYATIIRTIKNRSYVKADQGKFLPTELGMIVSDLLSESFPQIMDIEFTARMEEDLDRIELGELEWRHAVGSFYGPFSGDVEKARVQMEKVKDKLIATGIRCDKCEGELVIRVGRNGKFLACNNYPECKNTKNFFQDEKGNIRVVEDELAGVTCADCGREMLVKRWRGGRYLACSGAPACSRRSAYAIGTGCPACEKGEIVEKVSRKGRLFYACSEYPGCTYASWREPVERECPVCGNDIMLKKITRGKGVILECSMKGCRGKTEEDEG
ncbi:MAG: type I DNA topoisomerase [Deltaproteobacteria bacterium]|nr:type I DNA topoisomerase [Deltaproteobacteria bacterium]NIS76657.1 type I DNA topoisomerase [Deltaproteobacteria bacterium]